MAIRGARLRSGSDTSALFHCISPGCGHDSLCEPTMVAHKRWKHCWFRPLCYQTFSQEDLYCHSIDCHRKHNSTLAGTSSQPSSPKRCHWRDCDYCEGRESKISVAVHRLSFRHWFCTTCRQRFERLGPCLFHLERCQSEDDRLVIGPAWTSSALNNAVSSHAQKSFHRCQYPGCSVKDTY